MKRQLEGIDSLRSMIQTLRERANHISGLNGTIYDARTDSGIKEDRLFPDDESALKAAQHPGLESHFQQLSKELDAIMSKLK